MIIVTAGAYLQLADCGFINYDDPDYVTDNRALAHGFTFQAIRWAFTSSYSCNWHPLTWLSHLLDLQLFGLYPGGHHLTSLALHCANTVLVATLLQRVTGAWRRSLLVALLFGLHPLHVESVAWISERKDLLSAFFWLLAMHAYAVYARRPSGTAYGLTLSLFICGLLSKPMVVTFPLVLLLLDYWPLARRNSRSLRMLLVEKIPFFIFSTGSAVITYLAQSTGGAVSPGGSVAINAGNALISYIGYLEKTFLPVKLAYFYPFNPAGITPLRVAVATTLLASISLLVTLSRQRAPYLVTGWLWYLVTLVPVIGFIRIGDQAMADRYTYLPLIGIFIMLAWGGGELISGKRFLAQMAAVGAALTLLLLAVLTWRQTHYWQDDLTLNRHALEVTTGNWTAHHNLALELSRRGDLEGAIEQHRFSLRIHPDFERGHYSLGKLFLSMNRIQEGADSFRRAVESKPDFAAARYNLGYCYLLMGRPDLAQEQHAVLAQLDPVRGEALRDAILRYERRNR